MAKNIKIFILFFSALSILNCAGTSNSMKEPVEGKNLIIGSIIFENNGYNNRTEVYFENLEVAIMGYYEENGKEKTFGKWIYTDENGYFSIPNVPDGKYAVKAIRVNMSGQAYMTFANEFRTMIDNYKLSPENIAFSGTYFDTRPTERIVNLKHNYFTIFPNSEIRYGSYDMIAEFTASNGQKISRPLIFKYFIEKHPESGWNEHLNKVLSTYQK